MAIQGNVAQVTGILEGAAGKNNWGSGGDYFSPGRHVVEIIETTAGPSTKQGAKGVVNVIIQGRTIQSEGRESYLMLRDEKVVRRPETTQVPALKKGTERKQVLVSTKPNFDNDLGNFTLAAKKTFLAKYALCEECGLLDDFLGERWSPAQQVQVRAYAEKARLNPDATLPEDFGVIFGLDLALGLVMHVDAGEKANQAETIILTPLNWKPGSVSDQQLKDEGEE